MWALQKVGFTAGATQETQPWLSCTSTKVVFTCARICLIHSLVAELLTDHFAVQWVPTPTTNCSPLSIDVHFHTSFSLTGPTSQPNSNWMGESAQSALGAQHRAWSCTQSSTPSNSRSHYVCYHINACQILKGITDTTGFEFELEIRIPFVTAVDSPVKHNNHIPAQNNYVNIYGASPSVMIGNSFCTIIAMYYTAAAYNNEFMLHVTSPSSHSFTAGLP